MSDTPDLKCACPHCNGRIAFPAAAGGSAIACPHCGGSVQLPSTPAPAASSVSSNLKCACRHCNGRISFPPNAAGSMIPCPHCGKETPLMAPGVSTSAPAAPPPPPAAPAAPAARPAAPAATPPPPAAKRVGPAAPTEEELEEGAPAAKPKKSRRLGKGALIGILSLVVILAIAAGVIILQKKGGGVTSLLGPKSDLEVVNYELQKMKDTSLVYVVGKVKNNSDAQQTSVRVDFKLLDSAGKQIGNASDYIMILEPKQEWEFKALVVEADVAKVEVDKVTSSK